jgi:4-amino-4-deoxy-L-arabinose transferase-like glycosyltransferase
LDIYSAALLLAGKRNQSLSASADGVDLGDFFFVFFSVSGSKLPGYIVPIFPALALIGARQAAQGGEIWQKMSLATAGLLGVALIAGVQWKLPSLIAGKPDYEVPLYQGYAVWLQSAGVLFLMGAIGSWILLNRQQKDWSLLALGLSGFIAGQVAFLGHNDFGKYIAGTAHLPAMREVLKTPGSHFYGVGRYEQAMPFYLERTMTLVEFPDEMQFGRVLNRNCGYRNLKNLYVAGKPTYKTKKLRLLSYVVIFTMNFRNAACRCASLVMTRNA